MCCCINPWKSRDILVPALLLQDGFCLCRVAPRVSGSFPKLQVSQALCHVTSTIPLLWRLEFFCMGLHNEQLVHSSTSLGVCPGSLYEIASEKVVCFFKAFGQEASRREQRTVPVRETSQWGDKTPADPRVVHQSKAFQQGTREQTVRVQVFNYRNPAFTLEESQGATSLFKLPSIVLALKQPVPTHLHLGTNFLKILFCLHASCCMSSSPACRWKLTEGWDLYFITRPLALPLRAPLKSRRTRTSFY